MQNKFTPSRPLIFFLILFLSACAGSLQPENSNDPLRNRDMETADLADVTTDSLALAERTGRENVLVVFDIDNTILAMEQGLGADQWYEWQKSLANDDQCHPQNVGNRFAVQGALYYASAMRATQDDAARQVKTIQDSGLPVIVLTSRGPDFRLQTFRELRRNGFSFTHHAIGPPGGFDKSFIPVDNGRMSRYEDGVFMTAGQHKGQMLLALLQKTGTPLPAVIVIIDDKQKNLDAVKETFNALDVPVHAWRYSGEDANVAGFDPEQAHTDWKSIEGSLRQIQQVMGPDNYNLDSALLPADCE
jgi:hypothetical protein